MPFSRLATAAALLFAIAACEPVPSTTVDAGPTGCEGTATDDPQFVPAMDLVRKHASERNVPGIAIAIVRAGNVENIGVFGSKSAARCEPIDDQTRFLTFGGMHFTSAAAVMAADKGVLDLSAPITTYIPEFDVDPPADPSNIALRHVLANTTALGRELIIGCFDLDQWFQVYDSMPQWTPPGSIYLWQPVNTTLTAGALAAANGTSFEQAMRDHLFASFGIDAVYDPVRARKGNLASGYSNAQGGSLQPLNVSEGRCTAREPYQGLFASIGDFGGLLVALTRPSATRDALLAPRGDAFWAPDQTTYSGLVRSQLTDEREVLSMDVHASGYGYAIRIDPQEQLGIAVLVNANHGGADDLADALLRGYTGAVLHVGNPEPDTTGYAGLVGEYTDPFAMRTARVDYDGNALTIELFDRDAIAELVPAHRYGDDAAGWARDVFDAEIDGTPVTLRFWRDERDVGWIISEETIRSALGPPLLRRQ